MDMKQTLDVSRFMLIEATGDSEDDCDAVLEFGYDVGRADDDDDGDAQSCSYDGSDEGRNCNLGEQLNGYESCVSDADCDHRDERKKDEEVEAGVFGTSYCDDDDEIQKQSYCDDDDEIQKHHKSRFSVDSGQPLMDEMEKNRRFWEACLAS